LSLTGFPRILQKYWRDDIKAALAAIGAGVEGAHNLLSATHPDTDADGAPAEGDVLTQRGGVWVPQAPSSASAPLEGPGIDVVGTTVGLGGDTILLFNCGSSPVAEFAATSAGLDAASAAAVAGDVVQLPARQISGSHTLAAGVTYRGLGRKASVLTGQITLAASSVLETLSVSRTANSADTLIGVVGPSSGTGYLYDCDVAANNALGTGYAVQTTGTGEVYLVGVCRCTAQSGGVDSNPFEQETIYSLGTELGTGSVTVNDAAGDAIGGLSIGNYYAIESTGGPWTDGIGHNDYDYHLSNDGGAIWAMPPAWCFQSENVDANHTRVWFIATTTSIKIRVADSYFPDNGGSLGWKLSAVVVTVGDKPISYGCEIPNADGAISVTPTRGDRSAYDVTNYASLHGSDIEASVFTRHLPDATGANDGQVPTVQNDGTYELEAVRSVTLADIETYQRFVITAHRGDINATDGYPENTLAACRSAARRGAHRIEVDPRLNADGTWYLMHDDTVDRTTNGTGNVSAKTDAQMDALAIDGGYGYRAAHAGLYHPPTLASVLTALAPYDVTLQIDNKVGASAGALATYIVAQGWTQRVAINAYTQAEAQAIKAVDSRIRVVGDLAWAETDIYTPAPGYTENQVDAAAPVQVIICPAITDYNVGDEADNTRDAYDVGARGITTWNLPVALAEWRRIMFLTGARARDLTTHYEPLTDGSLTTPTLIFVAGDVIMAERAN
jgi:hypothetical protein